MEWIEVVRGDADAILGILSAAPGLEIVYLWGVCGAYGGGGAIELLSKRDRWKSSYLRTLVSKCLSCAAVLHGIAYVFLRQVDHTYKLWKVDKTTHLFLNSEINTNLWLSYSCHSWLTLIFTDVRKLICIDYNYIIIILFFVPFYRAVDNHTTRYSFLLGCHHPESGRAA